MVMKLTKTTMHVLTELVIDIASARVRQRTFAATSRNNAHMLTATVVLSARRWY